MEEWEKEIINKNLSKLIETTICNATLLAKLLESEILSSADVSALTTPVTSPCEQTLHFYTLIQTRVNAFEALLNALDHTKQSGAVAILSTGLAQIGRAVDVLPISFHNVSAGSNGTVVYKEKFGERDVAIKGFHIYTTDQTLQIVNVLMDRDTHENGVRHLGIEKSKSVILFGLSPTFQASNHNKQEKSSKLQNGFGLAKMGLEGRRTKLLKLNRPIRGVLEKGEIGPPSKNQKALARQNKFFCALM